MTYRLCLWTQISDTVQEKSASTRHLEEYAQLQSETTTRTCLTQTVTSTDSDLPPVNILHMLQYILITSPHTQA